MEFLSAQEAVKLVAWWKAFHWIPHKTFFQVAQDELKTGVTHMVATYFRATVAWCIVARRFVRV